MKVLITGGLPDLLVRLWHHLSRRRQRQFVLLLGLMLVSAFAEALSLGAVLPFLGILTAPDRVLSHPVVARVAQAWGITSSDHLVLPVALVASNPLVALVAIAGFGAGYGLITWQSRRRLRRNSQHIAREQTQV